MADVKWIKLSTELFDNRKIKHIRKLPEGNNILLIWIFLLTLAGRCNAGGMIFLTENIPYTVEMLSDESGFDLNTVKLALEVLSHFEMISTDPLMIDDWENHQNIDGLDKIREQTRKRVADHRARKKHEMLTESQEERYSNVTVTHCNAIDIEEEREREREKEKEYSIYLSDASESEKREAKDNPSRHKYGMYNNVLLSDEDISKLKSEFPCDWQNRIERLSEYVAATGKKYKSHLATIRSWARRDLEKNKDARYAQQNVDDDPLPY